MPFFSFTAGFAAYVLFVAFWIGAIAASALSCLAARLARGESWIRGRSRCDSCGRELGARDLIPVVSWLALRGRCRYCGAPIGRETPLCEAGMGLLFALLVVRYGVTLSCLRAWILLLVLYPAALCDLDTYEIPDRFAALGAVLWAALLAFSDGWKPLLMEGLLGAAALALIVLLTGRVMRRILGREAMGGGDVKLYAVCGLYLGPIAGMAQLILSCVIGLAGGGWLSAHAAKDDDVPEGAFPFAPAIALAAAGCIFLGTEFGDWYMGLFL